MTNTRPLPISGGMPDAITDRETVLRCTGAERLRERIGVILVIGSAMTTFLVFLVVGLFVWIGFVLVPFVLLLALWCLATHAGLAVRVLARDATP